VFWHGEMRVLAAEVVFWRGWSDRPCQEGVVRPTWLGGQTAPRNLGGLVFEVVSRVVLVLEVVILVVGLESLQVVSLLGILPLVLNTGM
jgi:hypothetical protein